MKRFGLVLALAVASAGGAAAQNPPQPMPQDTGRAMMRMPMMGEPQGPGPEAMRMQIEERWGHRVQTELGLTDQLMDRLRTAERANQDRHRDLNRREEDLHRTVRAQLQPGVAANAAALNDALDQLAAIRVQHAQSDQQLMRDLAFLAPVQRARYFIMARQFQEMIQDVRVRQGMRVNPQSGGMRPGMPMEPRRPVRRPGGAGGADQLDDQ